MRATSAEIVCPVPSNHTAFGSAPATPGARLAESNTSPRKVCDPVICEFLEEAVSVACRLLSAQSMVPCVSVFSPARKVQVWQSSAMG